MTLDIGTNLLTLLMALIPSVAILAAAIAAYIHTKTVEQIRTTAEDTNRQVTKLTERVNGGSIDVHK